MDTTETTLHRDMIAALRAYDTKLASGLKASGFEGASLIDGAVLALVMVASKSMVQMAVERGVSKQAIQSQVKSLDARGLVSIEPDPSDARARLVSPSAKGRQLVEALDQIQADLDADIETKLGTERLKNFRNILGQVVVAAS